MKTFKPTLWIAAFVLGSVAAVHAGVSAQVLARGPQSEIAHALGVAAAQSEAPVSVVVNHEEQYGIWPQEVPVPAGWRQLAGDQTMEAAARHLASRVGDLAYQVVVNHEEQYAIWPMSYPVPEGFKAITQGCTIVECAKQVKA